MCWSKVPFLIQSIFFSSKKQRKISGLVDISSIIPPTNLILFLLYFLPRTQFSERKSDAFYLYFCVTTAALCWHGMNIMTMMRLIIMIIIIVVSYTTSRNKKIKQSSSVKSSRIEKWDWTSFYCDCEVKCVCSLDKLIFIIFWYKKVNKISMQHASLLCLSSLVHTYTNVYAKHALQCNVSFLFKEINK